MIIIALLAIITIVQIVIGVMVSSNINDCDRYKLNQQYSISINMVDSIKRKSSIINKLNILTVLLLGILWGLIIMK